MKKREIFAWGMYDLANTIFSALFITFFFPFFIKTFLGGNEFHLGLTYGISMLLVGLIVPFIGAWSDALKRRVPFVMGATFACCVATVLVGFVPLWAALFFGLVANFAYHAALTTYNALLPSITTKRLGFVSGIGVAMGYVGTLIALAAAWPVLNILGWETMIGSQSMFILTALLFGLLSLFTLFGIKEKNRGVKAGAVRHALRDVLSTVPRLGKDVWYFLGAMFLFADGITTAILFLFLYARETIGLGVQSFFIVYAIFSVAAIFGSMLAGRRTDTYGPKPVLVICGLLWIGVIILLVSNQALWSFILGGSLGGIALGTFWTASRPLLVKLAPKRKVGQYFGFMELTDKWSGVLGPVIFGWLVIASGYKAALLSLLVFFVLGLACLAKVKR